MSEKESPKVISGRHADSLHGETRVEKSLTGQASTSGQFSSQVTPRPAPESKPASAYPGTGGTNSSGK